MVKIHYHFHVETTGEPLFSRQILCQDHQTDVFLSIVEFNNAFGRMDHNKILKDLRIIFTVTKKITLYRLLDRQMTGYL